MVDQTSKKPHAILVSYPLQGHVIPSVHLAIKLASQGFTITFINTHAFHHQISKAQPNSEPDIFTKVRESGLDIRYATISDGLPVGFDRSLNHDQYMAALLHVFSAHVDEVVGQIVKSDDSVRCLIADTFFVWPSKIAKKFGLLYVSFWTEPALVFSLYYHMDLLRINGHFGCQDCREDIIDYIPGVKAMEPKDMTSYLQEAETTSVCHQIIFNAFKDTRSADFVVCNSVQELEVETLSALQAKMPYYAIGPLFPSSFTKSFVATSLWSESDCTQWLDEKPRGSVLYVSFGSYAHVTKKDLAQIANGLSLSKVSFVWVLRADIVGINLSDRKFVTKEEVSSNINSLFSGKLGDELRTKIKEVKKTLENALSPGGSSEKNMAQFIKDLKNKISEKMDQPNKSICNDS
uniref:Glycosyltransferase family protein n=1 Tax=Populus alba TaxID=43335 RepID=A0A4U5P7X5_POPAL|nr:glycosyltransferase family protein [Populus alba]